MKEYINSLYTSLKDRSSNPFYGTFILAWLAWNWRVWYSLFFVNEKDFKLVSSTKTRLEFLHDQLGNSNNTLWIPLLISITVLVAGPILNLGAVFVIEWFNSLKKHIKRNRDKNSFLSIGDGLALIEAMEESEKNAIRITQLKDKRITSLESESAEHLKSINKQQKTIQSNNREITELQTRLKIYDHDIIKSLLQEVNQSRRSVSLIDFSRIDHAINEGFTLIEESAPRTKAFKDFFQVLQSGPKLGTELPNVHEDHFDFMTKYNLIEQVFEKWFILTKSGYILAAQKFNFPLEAT